MWIHFFGRIRVMFLDWLCRCFGGCSYYSYEVHSRNCKLFVVSFFRTHSGYVSWLVMFSCRCFGGCSYYSYEVHSRNCKSFAWNSFPERNTNATGRIRLPPLTPSANMHLSDLDRTTVMLLSPASLTFITQWLSNEKRDRVDSSIGPFITHRTNYNCRDSPSSFVLSMSRSCRSPTIRDSIRPYLHIL